MAQGLRKANIPCLIYEKDAAFESRSQGYRFGLAEPGVKALQANLAPNIFEKFNASCSLISENGPPGCLDVVSGGPGENLFHKMLTNKKGPPGQSGENKKLTPPMKVDRRTLRDVLIQGLEPQTRFGKQFRSFQETADGVDVTFSDGSVVSGSIVVGADGSWSKVRQQIFPQYTLRDCETRPILGKTRITSDLRKQLTENVLQGFTLLQSPEFSGMADPMCFDQSIRETPNDYVFWVLFLKLENYPDHATIKTARKSPQEAVAFVQKATADWHKSIRCLFEQPGTAAGQVQTFTATPSQLAANPQAGSRVTLIGDAAHLMAPTGGSGAVTALRDAALLAKMLDREGADPRVLRSYEEEMIQYARQAYEQTLAGGKAIFGFKGYENMPTVRL